MVEKSEGGGGSRSGSSNAIGARGSCDSWTCKDRKGEEGVSVGEEGEQSWSIFMKASCRVRLFKS